MFSGMDPFPGNIGQIYLAKIHNKTPKIPPEFPAALKELFSTGWAIKPEDRPELEKFRSAFCLILKQEEEKILTGNNEAKIKEIYCVAINPHRGQVERGEEGG